MDTFRANQSGLFDFDTFWRRSVTAASAGRAIAGLSSATRKEEAFLAGLMLKIGVLALNSALGDRYGNLFRLAGGDYHRLIEIERERLDLDHATVGAALSEEWRLPAQLTEAIRMHPTPHQAGAESEWLVRVAALSDDVACAFTAVDVPSAVDTARHHAQQWFDFGEDATDRLLQDIHAATGSMQRLFDLDPGDMPSPEELLGRANEALTQISLQNALEATPRRGEPPPG